MLVNILECTGQPQPQRVFRPKMSIILRLKSLDLEYLNGDEKPKKKSDAMNFRPTELD